MCRSNKISDIQTGFEDLTSITPSYDNEYSLLENIVSSKHCFKNRNNTSYFGKSYIQYHKGTISDRLSNIIEYPINSGNKVLQFKLKSPNTVINNHENKGRVQLNIYNNIGIKHIDMSVRMYLHQDFNIIKSYPKSFNWLTISEWWNNAGWTDEDYPFRISLNIIKEHSMKSSPLVFKISAQTLNIKKRHWDQTIWQNVNRTFILPIDEWLTLKFKIIEGNTTNGRFIFSVIDQDGKLTNIFTINNYTHHPSDASPDGFTHINPIKLYTSGILIDYIRNNGGALQILWDDLKISTDSN
ncbi:MAG: hypothetical protein ABW104_11500 [Candidatus Thiodiazotropha sp. 6PLUC2]